MRFLFSNLQSDANMNPDKYIALSHDQDKLLHFEGLPFSREANKIKRIFIEVSKGKPTYVAV